MQGTFAVKILGGDIGAKALMSIKRLTDLPISDIKQRIEKEEPIFSCDWADEGGLEAILELHDTLEREGVTPLLYIGDMQENVGYFRNLLTTFKEIDGESC